MEKKIVIFILIALSSMISSCSSQVDLDANEHVTYGENGYVKEESINDINEHIILEKIEFYLQDSDTAFTVQLIYKDEYFPEYSDPQYYLQVYNVSNNEHQLIRLGSTVISNLRVLDLFHNNFLSIIVTSGYSGDSRSRTFMWHSHFEEFQEVAYVSHEISFTSHSQVILYAQVIVKHDSYGIEIRNENGDLVQHIYVEPSEDGLPVPLWIAARDLNNDGHLDIVAHRGGTQNFVHDLFVWKTDLQEFSKVIYVDFESLSFFEIHDGYLINTLRSFEYNIIQTLIWEDGNKLIKVHEERQLFE